ncbi:GyrI-like domain-containing protein [Haloferax sp. DFSO52]|uniref:GyrI-like domain-containing protein n=1 Tax=Haloferax sp. DFSO52 TaxID=3388505 RepID=UPI003A86DAEC
MESVDYKRELKHLYRQSDKDVSLVEVPPLSYLMLDGAGNPNTSPTFSAAVETLYPLSYAIRAIVKDEQDLKYVVMPLEGLWWTDEMDDFDVANKDDWQWTLLIMQPDVVTDEIVERARETVSEKKDLPSLSAVRFETLDEGLSAQTLHVGPFSEEGPTVERVHEFIEQSGYDRRGKHHEIYLSDMRRADPENLKTIIRQPVADRFYK